MKDNQFDNLSEESFYLKSNYSDYTDPLIPEIGLRETIIEEIINNPKQNQSNNNNNNIENKNNLVELYLLTTNTQKFFEYDKIIKAFPIILNKRDIINIRIKVILYFFKN
jgi:hypothetical protein